MHLFLDIDGGQPNSSWRVLLLSFSSSWTVIYRVGILSILTHKRAGVMLFFYISIEKAFLPKNNSPG